ncbi:YhcN/YlaJ family sporulation lipoprotein, partial [Calditerricola satsumensis]|uniref:YhcN/YlaJ family sporulation lipoprotein n=1 Tax=Calditerricola satsumensis TaxID=373054 RepID=UPI00155DD031
GDGPARRGRRHAEHHAPAEALNQVKRGVQSIVPRYYRVSVSADEAAVQRMASRIDTGNRTAPVRNLDRQ